MTALRCCLLKPEHLGVAGALAGAVIAALDGASASLAPAAPAA